MNVTRVDQWLWAIRLYKSRSLSTTACKGGHVKVNGRPAKPSTPLKAGDRVTVTTRDEVRDLEVVRPIDKRVGAPIAETCFIDHTPPRVQRHAEPAFGVRDRGAGKPTRRELKQINRMRGRSD